MRFWPEVRDMPPFVPGWMSVVAVRKDGDGCGEDD
jgi:hypothetical protein